jgi:precorrin-6B methylase 2
MIFSFSSKWKEVIKSTYSLVPNGYKISPRDRRQIDPEGKGAVYGEILFNSVSIILDAIEITKDDTFIDLGSGTGKIVMQVALTRPIKKAIGIEISRERFETSIQAKAYIMANMIEEERRIWDKKVAFFHGDILKHPLDDVSCAFMCSTCFRDEVIDSCAERLLTCTNLRAVASMVRFSNELEKEYDLYHQGKISTSWSETSKIYYYRPKK